MRVAFCGPIRLISDSKKLVNRVPSRPQREELYKKGGIDFPLQIKVQPSITGDQGREEREMLIWQLKFKK